MKRRSIMSRKELRLHCYWMILDQFLREDTLAGVKRIWEGADRGSIFRETFERWVHAQKR